MNDNDENGGAQAMPVPSDATDVVLTYRRPWRRFVPFDAPPGAPVDPDECVWVARDMSGLVAGGDSVAEARYRLAILQRQVEADRG